MLFKVIRETHMFQPKDFGHHDFVIIQKQALLYFFIMYFRKIIFSYLFAYEWLRILNPTPSRHTQDSCCPPGCFPGPTRAPRPAWLPSPVAAP